MAHKLERPAREMLKRALGDLTPVRLQLLFGGTTASGKSCRMFSRGTPTPVAAFRGDFRPGATSSRKPLNTASRKMPSSVTVL